MKELVVEGVTNHKSPSHICQLVVTYMLFSMILAVTRINIFMSH